MDYSWSYSITFERVDEHGNPLQRGRAKTDL
jgi:hypothetical protein